MNCEHAKNISIVEFLNKNSIQPQKTTQNEAWYCSPFRNEKTASFKVNINQNNWYDFGIGQGGNMLDFACMFFNTDITGALKKLSLFTIPQINIKKDFIAVENKKRIEIKHIQPLQNKALIDYCESRKIPFMIAKQYIQEAYYSVNSKGNYFALAFKNDKGGFELRNKLYKAATTPKYITTIKGANSKILAIFEGFFDFLSACVYFNTAVPQNDVIILNSLSFTDLVLNIIPAYEKINLFIDNDPAGQLASKNINQHHKNAGDFSQKIYPAYKDFNDYLIKK